MTADDIKLYQLCGRIADIFDQYLVYRPIGFSVGAKRASRITHQAAE